MIDRPESHTRLQSVKSSRYPQCSATTCNSPIHSIPSRRDIPLILISRLRMRSESVVRTGQWEYVILRDVDRKRIAAWKICPRIRKAGRVLDRNAVSVWRRTAVAAVCRQVRPVIENSIRGANGGLAFAGWIPCESETRRELRHSMETDAAAARHSCVAREFQSCRRIRKNRALHACVECRAIKIAEADVVDVNGQVRFPS